MRTEESVAHDVLAPTEEEIDEALDMAASGMTSTDQRPFNKEIQAVLDRVSEQGRVLEVDEEEAWRLRDEWENNDNIAEANAEADAEAAAAAEMDPTTIR